MTSPATVAAALEKAAAYERCGAPEEQEVVAALAAYRVARDQHGVQDPETLAVALETSKVRGRG